jgi:hypothetical protein
MFAVVTAFNAPIMGSVVNARAETISPESPRPYWGWPIFASAQSSPPSSINHRTDCAQDASKQALREHGFWRRNTIEADHVPPWHLLDLHR